MKLKYNIILCGLSMLIWKGDVQAQVEFVGNDLETEGSWRDNFVEKSDDIDEDSIYGTKGYILPAGKRKGRARDPWLKDNVITASKDSLNKLPPYIKSLEFADSNERGSSYGGEENDSDYGTLDYVQSDFPSHKGLAGAPIMLNGADALTKNLSIYFRNTFQYDGEKNVKLRVLADDGFVAYINGKEIARHNMPEGEIGFETTASSAKAGDAEAEYNQFDVPDGAMKNGENTIAVEVHQSDANSSDMGFDMELVAGEEELVSKGETWSYSDSPTFPGAEWANEGFDDSAWAIGDAPLGYEDLGGITPTTVIRKGEYAKRTDPMPLILKRQDSPKFRLTLIFGNKPGFGDQGQNVTLDDGNGEVSQVIEQFDGSAHTSYQLWDIPAGSSDIKITIESLSEDNSRLSGLAFDDGEPNTPWIQDQPLSGSAIVGQSYELSVTAWGEFPLEYQWYKDGAAIDGATAKKYTIDDATEDASGVYEVVVTNELGETSSNEANVLVTLTNTVGYVGEDKTTKGSWRTNSVLKELDGDGDNIYGSDGWVIWQYHNDGWSGEYNPDDTASVLPSYIASVSNPPHGWGGADTSNFGLIDDPLYPEQDAFPEGDKMNAKWAITAIGQTPEETVPYVIKRSSPTPFRLCVILSQWGGGGNRHEDITVIMGDGRSKVTHTSDPALVEPMGAQYHLFDIGPGMGDIQIIVNNNDNDNPGIGGIAFDRYTPISFVGVDRDSGPSWRTASAQKPLDPDGDNVWGTDGWVVWQYHNDGWSGEYNPDDTASVLPSYISSISDPAHGWGGADTSNFGLMDDPLYPEQDTCHS